MLTDVAGLSLALVAAVLASARPPGPDLGVPPRRILAAARPAVLLAVGGSSWSTRSAG
jgi:Co/Zn/Cd efflux system component